MTHTRNYHVEGVRCARCIHAIESALQQEEAVTQARVNMSTNRLSISWEGDESLEAGLAGKVETLGYHVTPCDLPDNGQREDRFLLRCMAIAGFAMGNIMLISFALWSSNIEMMGLATRELLHWISAGIALPTIAYAGQPFFISALNVLKHGRTNMDVPISLALLLASGMSLFETYHSGEHAYFDSAVMLLFFLLIGRWLDARARGKARENAQTLLEMMRGTATVIGGETQKTIPINELTEGMLLRIAVGEKIPTDVEIVSGTSELDTSLVTGETIPLAVKPGDTAYGGTLNLAAPVTARVMKASEDSLLADIIRLMEQAEQGRAHYVQLADKAARLYTPVVHTLAASAFVGWLFIGGVTWQEALLIAITTLIITCPCALGLAVPVVQVLATSWLMKRGITVKSGNALERLATIDYIIFDKTGTLTIGRPVLVGNYEPEMLQLAASLAAHSHHPYSRAIVNAYKGHLLNMTAIQEHSGSGMAGNYQGHAIFLGRGRAPIPAVNDGDGHARIYLYRDEQLLCTFHLQDPLREDSQEIISLFRQQRIGQQLLSGDNAKTTKQLAEKADITQWQGDMLPQKKTQAIIDLQSQGHKVLMVGDGLNDAPSMTQANIAISPASGMDITQNAADIVFQGKLLAPVWLSWRMATCSTVLIKQNFALAALYNCLAIPLAVAGYVTPLVAAIAMSSSSLLVIANSFRINMMRDGRAD